MKNLSLCLFYLFAVALTRASSAQTPPNYRKAIPANQVYHYAWTTAKWRGDDKPYYTVRMQIVSALRSGKSFDALIDSYENRYRQNPKDNLSLFGWACAIVYPRILHLRSHMDFYSVPYTTQLENLLRAFDGSKPPCTYEFMRMRYLAVEQSSDRNDYTTALGERLAAQDKNDFDVIYYVGSDISKNTPGAKEKSLGYARRLIELDPNRGTGYGLMADRYYYHWGLYGMNPEDARQSIHWDGEYLKHENRTGSEFDRGRETSRLSIIKLQKWLAAHK